MMRTGILLVVCLMNIGIAGAASDEGSERGECAEAIARLDPSQITARCMNRGDVCIHGLPWKSELMASQRPGMADGYEVVVKWDATNGLVHNLLFSVEECRTSTGPDTFSWRIGDRIPLDGMEAWLNDWP